MELEGYDENGSKIAIGVEVPDGELQGAIKALMYKYDAGDWVPYEGGGASYWDRDDINGEIYPKTTTDKVKVDSIKEYTLGAGVDIESLNIKGVAISGTANPYFTSGSGQSVEIGIMPADGDGTDNAELTIFGVTGGNSERMGIGWSAGNSKYIINVRSNGVDRPLEISTPGGAKLELDTYVMLKSDLETDRWTDNDKNTLIGVGVCGAGNLDRGYNTAIGYQTLHDNTTGQENTADGYQALLHNTTGKNNTANGSQVLWSNTEGDFNAANGNYALWSNTTGHHNTANGCEALYYNKAGNDNIGIGHRAGNFIADGSTPLRYSNNSLYLGVHTKALEDYVDNEIVIGYNAIGNGSNTVTLGNDNITDTILKGTVEADGIGIGTSSPSYALDVNGDISLEAGSGNYYSNDGSQGWSGTFTNGDGATVTVKNGIITNVV